MRIIRRRRKKNTRSLNLKVDIIEAKELVVADASSCVMVAGIAFNGRHSKKTQKVKRTANPTWNSTHLLKLTGSAVGCPNIQIAVFDKHRRYSIYLGEIRLSITDLFKIEDTKSFTLPPKWYKLHSSSSQNSYVTGSIKIGFELVSKFDILEAYKEWTKTVLPNTKQLRLNDQDYYSETDTDVESLMIEDEIDKLSHLTIPETVKKKFPHMALDINENSSLGSGYDSPNTSDGFLSTTLHAMKHPFENKSEVAGVIFLQILTSTGLPPKKGRMRKDFDMDPYVVISCGKKTFRTSWRKHTLSPVFSEHLAFEILTKEDNFDLVFNIFDKEHISFHDHVAHGSISLSDVLEHKEFEFYDLKLNLHHSLEQQYGQYEPYLKFSVKFTPYTHLKDELWSSILTKYGSTDKLLDIVQLTSFLETVNIDEDLENFFAMNNKTIEENLSVDEVVKVLKRHTIELNRCPICEKRKQTDMVTHVAICAFKGNKLKSYATAGFASKKWYSKVFIKFAYGKYALGKNNANILVQDRLTGFIIEEKMSLYIRLGIRLLYKGTGADSRRVKNLLKSMSIKQGAKFNLPTSTKDIEPFIKFYKLDLSECLHEDPADYKNFNEFFARKLKTGSRAPESRDERIIVSGADSRCTTFNNVSTAKQFWIKSRQFTVKKLLGNAYDDRFEDCSLTIFRLAPQDYHRFHSPVSGVIGKATYIEGEYYTVNPMAIRSDLDVYGENVRVIVPIETEHFGTVIVICVGAMMVGSTVLTVKEGDSISRSDELGYFKFGGSTIITLFQKGTMQFDSDLLANSSESIETLVRVGMSIGHSNDIEEFKRVKVNFEEEPEEVKLKIIRTITGGDNDRPWEFYNMKGFDEDLENSYDDESYEEDENDSDDSSAEIEIKTFKG